MKLFKSLKDNAQSYLAQYQQRDPATYAAAQQAVGGMLILDGFIGIDNPLGGKKRSGIFGTFMGIVLGIIFMFVPVIFNNLSGFDKMTATTNATVVSVGTQSAGQSSSSACSLTAKYTVNGTEYTQTSSGSSSSNCSKTVGSSLVINYDPQNPGAWSADTKTVGMFINVFFWVGLFVAISSVITFVIRLVSIIFGWKILKSGRALAKTLPEGTNLGSVIDEIKRHFTSTVFGSANPMPFASTQPSVMAVPVAQTQPITTPQPFPVETPFVDSTAPYAPPAPSTAPTTPEPPVPPSMPQL